MSGQVPCDLSFSFDFSLGSHFYALGMRTRTSQKKVSTDPKPVSWRQHATSIMFLTVYSTASAPGGSSNWAYLYSFPAPGTVADTQMMLDERLLNEWLCESRPPENPVRPGLHLPSALSLRGPGSQPASLALLPEGALWQWP